jgi:hypothetical protein
MAGFIYRRAVDLKEFGERHNLPCLIRLGLALKDWVRYTRPGGRPNAG